MKKRVLAMLLALVMLIGALPVGAFATEATDPTAAPCETEGCAYAAGHEGDCSNYVAPTEACGTEGCEYAAGHEGDCSNYVAPTEACSTEGCEYAAGHEGNCSNYVAPVVCETEGCSFPYGHEGDCSPTVDQAAAQNVTDLINAIGEVTPESEAAISAADTAYNALTDEQKALVTNVDVLEAAKAAYGELTAVPEPVESAVPVAVYSSGTAASVTGLGTFGDKQYWGGYQIPVYYAKVSETASISVSYSGDYLALGSDYYSSLDQSALTGVTKADLEAYLATASDYGLYTDNSVVYIEFATNDGYYSSAFGLVIEFEPEAPAAYTVTLPSGQGYSATAYGESASPVDAGGSYSFTVTVEDGYDGTAMVVMANGDQLTAVDNVYTIENISEDQAVTVTGVEQKVTLPVSVTADGTAASVTGLGTFGDKQYWGGYQIPVYYAKVSETASISVSYSESYLALGSDYYSTLEQSALTGVTKADLEAYLATASDYSLSTDNSVVYIEFATNDGYYSSAFGLVIEFEPASDESGSDDSGSGAASVTVTSDGTALEVTSLGSQSYPDTWGDPVTVPFFTVRVNEGSDFTIDGSAVGVVNAFHISTGASLYGTHPYTMTASTLESYFLMSADAFNARFTFDHGLNTENKVAFIEARNNGDRVYCLLVELLPTSAESGDDDSGSSTGPVSVTADGTAAEVTALGTFGDKQYWGGYQIPVYYAKVSETASISVSYSEDYLALGSDYYNSLEQGTLSGVTKADLEAYLATASDYSLSTDNSVVYIEFATNDGYYSSAFGLVIEFEPASGGDDSGSSTGPVSVTADGTAASVTGLGTFGDKQYWGGYQIPVYYAKVSETASISVSYSENYLALGSDYYSGLDQSALTGVTKADLEAYLATASDYSLSTDNSVVYIEFATNDGYYSSAFGLVIEFEPEAPAAYTVTLPSGQGYSATAYGESASPVDAGGSYSFTVTVEDGYDGTAMVVMANGSELTAVDNVYTIENISEDQAVTVTGVEQKVTLPVSVTADGTAASVTGLGTFGDKQYWGGYQIPVYYAKVSETASISVSYSESYLALGSDYYSTLDQSALTGVAKADLEAYLATASDYGLSTDNSVVYIEFATNDGYYTSAFGLVIEFEPASGESGGDDSDSDTVPISVTADGTAAEVTYQGDFTVRQYGDNQIPVYYAKVSEDATVTISCSDGAYVPYNPNTYYLGYQSDLVDLTKANLEAYFTDAAGYGLDTTNGVAYIELTTDDGFYISTYGLLIELEPASDESGDDDSGSTGPVSVTADGAAVAVTDLGTFADKQYWGGYQIPVYYAKVSDAASISVSYSESYLALGSDYYSTLEQGALTDVTKADLEAYLATASDYSLSTDNSVVYIEFATNDGYYSSAFGLVIELEPTAVTTYTVTLPTGEGYVAEASGESASPVKAGGSYSFTVSVVQDYDSSAMVVMANGNQLTAVDNIYTIENIGEDQTVTITGVVRKATQAGGYITVIVEKHDADGNGSVLLNPTHLLKEDYVNDYVIPALQQAMGSSGYVKYETTQDNGSVYSVTGIYDPSQADSYLNNGDQEGFRWQVLINNEAWSGRDYNSAYKLQSGDVIRCIYTGETPAGQTDKDALVQLAADASAAVQQKPAYQAALDTIASSTASAADVENAIAELQNAMVVNAVSVAITAGEELDLRVNQTLTLQAALLPANATEALVWSTSNSSIVSVDAASGQITGVSSGTAQVTVTAGAASDTIQVYVTAVDAQSVTITNGDVSLEARFSVQLEAAISPEDSTELVVWSVGDESIATVNASGKLTGVAPGTTTVTATAGSVSHSVNVTVSETTSPYVYFRYSDGSVQELKDDTFTLTVLDEGSFVVGNSATSPKWTCSEYVSDGSGGFQYNYWINSEGKYQPHGAQDMTATVSAGGFNKTFTIRTVPSGISQIKVYTGDQERGADNPYEVTGMVSGIPVTVKGLNEEGAWVYIPTQALEITSSNTNIVRFLGNQMNLIREGSAQITVSMVDNADVSVSFEAICNTVQVTGFDVIVPETFIIDKWDSMGNVFVGIYQGYDDPDTQYYVYYTPSNATNQDLIWEDLTPEIAEYDEGWSTGIVPKKAGTAKFKVTSVSNPEVSREVTVNFEYKTPLENAVSSQEAYEMNVGDSLDPELTFTPGNATETRFTWTYSQDGIVQVKESVTSVGYSRVVSRKIIALAAGTVTVTGTPVDDTAGCPNVVFTVTVTGDGETESFDYLQMAKEDITHGLDYLAGQSQASYGSEWTIFTNLRSGGYIDAQSRILYLQSVADELTNNPDGKKPTDYARLVLTLPLLGVDPENFEGINLIEKLYNGDLANQTSNQISWTLMALDSRNYDIPEDALWNRDQLIAKVLTFQASDGSFALDAGRAGDVDMTGMILQALAPYYGSDPQVSSAVDSALEYLKAEMTENIGYISGGAENSCTAAQVLTALAALNIDPTDSANGFTLGAKNLVTNLDSFRQDRGFAYLLGESTNTMGTQQTTYALEAYRRYAEGQNALYDLTDVGVETETVTYEVTLPTGEGYTAEAADGSQSPIEAGGRYTFTVTLADGYTRDENFAVKANGIALTEAEGKYTITNIRSNQTITVEGVRKALENETFTVTLPSGEGYTANAAGGSASPVAYGGSYSFTVTIGEGYEKTGDFAVKVNGTTLTEVSGKYTIHNINADQTVTVTGVQKKVGPITVRFSLLGCYTHSDGETTVHTLIDGNLQTWIPAQEYEIPADSTVKDLLETVLAQNGFSCSNPTGNYVESINGIGEFTNGNKSGWMYTLNGVHPSLGVAEQKLQSGDVIVFHYTDDYTREDGSQGSDDTDTDAKAAEAVEKLIDAIGTVTLNSASKINAARQAYNALTYAQKQLVDNYTKLTAAETRFAQLVAADNEKKASAVEAKINAIKEDSSTFEEDVLAAQTAYNALTNAQKQLVDNYSKLSAYLKSLAATEDQEAAEAVEKLIGALGTITLDSVDEIKAAREAYDALTDEQKELVENLAVLEAAEAALEQLKALARVEGIYQTTGDYLEDRGTPVPGSIGGEWMVIGLARSGREIEDVEDYYASVVRYVQENIDEDERLHRAKSTENARLILALTSIGKDVTDVSGHNLLAGLDSMKYIQKQGINGPIWALIAFDSGNYPTPEGDVTREALIEVILDAQLADGGWALSGDASDPDLTGMAVQALAPYYQTNDDVKAALDEAVETMSRMQAADGSFSSTDGANSESISQVIVALAALGIDAGKDERFIKNGISALDALCAFYVRGGGFTHIPLGALDGMATEQGYYALTAYFRMLDGKTGLYDMTDVAVTPGGAGAAEAEETLPEETEPDSTEPAQERESWGGFPWWIIIVILILVAGAIIVVIVNRKKLFKKVS